MMYIETMCPLRERHISLSPSLSPQKGFYGSCLDNNESIGFIAHISKSSLIVGGDHALVTHWYG